MNIVHSNPAVLKWAREQSGFKLEEVANKLRRRTITAKTITAWENGEAFPSYAQLEDLAYKIYKRPLALFFFPEPPDESDIKQSFRTLSEPINNLNPKMRFMIRKARVMQLNLIELYENQKQEKQIFQDIKFNTHLSINSLSQKVREYLGIDLNEQKKWKNTDKALLKWRSVLESCGIFIFKDSFKESKFSGFCLYDSNFPVIYLNSKETSSRQIFTLFHELAHILFQTSGFDPLDKTYFRSQLNEDNKKIEIMCNEFAGVFLVPEDSLPAVVAGKNVTIDNVIKWAKGYSVSPEVFLRRLKEKKFISQTAYNNLVQQAKLNYQQISKNRKKIVDPYIVRESQLGKKYISLVYSKYYKDQISIEKLADFLGVKPDFALRLEPYSRIKKRQKDSV